jgi:multicomponent Na+:H+ antiporter subunit B
MTRQPLILQVAARPLYGLILAAAVWILLRGHNEPGGGFIAGLVAVSATVLWAVAFDAAAATRRLPLRSPVALGAAGVLMAALAGLPAWWGGQPYMTHLWFTLDLGFTALKLSTVMLFDLGVALCVWGALAGYALALLDLDMPQAESASPRGGGAPAAPAAAQPGASRRRRRAGR